MRVEDVMQGRPSCSLEPEPITLFPWEPLETAAELMLAHEVEELPVVEGDLVVGSVHWREVLAGLLRQSRLETPGSRLEVDITHHPDFLSDLGSILTAHRTQLTAILSCPPDASGRQMVAVRIHTIDPRPIIRDLSELGYKVYWPAAELVE